MTRPTKVVSHAQLQSAIARSTFERLRKLQYTSGRFRTERYEGFTDVSAIIQGIKDADAKFYKQIEKSSNVRLTIPQCLYQRQ
jgi:hypothetical protein